MRKIPLLKPLQKQHWPVWIVFLIGMILVVFAVHERIVHTYLEDDMLWFIPLIAQMLAKYNLLDFLGRLNAGELSFIDGAYFASLVSVFGYRFSFFTWILLFWHMVNTFLLYALLRSRFHLAQQTSAVAALIYLCFYGQFHAYTFLMSFHHLTTVFFILLILNVYLKTDERMERQQPFIGLYVLTVLLCLPAAIQRLSILILPLLIFIHLLSTTKEKQRVVFKFTFWIPLFVIFFTYQLLIGNHGDVLGHFLKPFDHIWPDRHSFLAVIIALVLSPLPFMIFRFLLKFYLQRFSLESFQRVFKATSWLILLTPALLVLSICLLLQPLHSAISSADALERWQRLQNPMAGWMLVVIYIFVWAIMVRLIRRIGQQPSFILFPVWYAAVTFYFSGYSEQIPSRYLVYISPLMALFLALFFTEDIPQKLSGVLRKWYFAVFYAFLAFVLMQNILAIKFRSTQTLLLDYHWSYDYIKTAHLIKGDLYRRFPNEHWLSKEICISGVKNIPYQDTWAQGFLKSFDFERFDSFKQTLRLVLDGQDLSIGVNECSPTSLTYTLDSATVNVNGKSIEPFYIFLEEGIHALQHNDRVLAADYFARATEIQPFLLRFMKVPPVFARSSFNNTFRKNLATAIRGIYAVSYDEDKRMHYIDSMIRREVYDYALALTLLAYAREGGPLDEKERLLGEAALFVSQRELKEYLQERGIVFAKMDDFYQFLDDYASVFGSGTGEVPWTDLEYDHGFRIYRYGNYYFAQPAEKKYLDLVYYKTDACPLCFMAKTKRELRMQISLPTTPKPDSLALEKEIETIEEMAGITIIRRGEMYYGLAAAQMREGFWGGLEAVALFRTRSLAEARQIGRMTASLPETISVQQIARVRQLAGKFLGRPLTQTLKYKLLVMNIPLGYMTSYFSPTTDKEQGSLQGLLTLHPPQWITKLSSDRVGMEWKASLDPASMLPYFSQQVDLYSQKKGKSPKAITYKHPELYIERKGRQEDIFSDTRDYVSVWAWLMSRDYDHVRLIKTTFNINRTLYLFVGQIHPIEGAERPTLYVLDGKITALDYEKSAKQSLEVTIYLIKGNDAWYTPVLVYIRNGLLPILLKLV